jgi:hypothetical protein
VTVANTAPSSSSLLTVRSLIEMLASSLGWEKSAEVVDAAVARLKYPPVLITPAQASDVLAELAKVPGMVGVTARFARTRMGLAGPTPPSTNRTSSLGSPTSNDNAPPASSRKNAARSIFMAEVVKLIAGSVGDERAEEAVLDAVRRLRLPSRALSRNQTLAVFDDLASRAGPVGTAARFAKARAILLFGG